MSLRDNADEGLALWNVMFETLTKILNLPSTNAIRAALHGLGHLHHPETEKLIEAWLEREKPTDPDLIAYARAAAKFKVL
jgi:hypothetical protein